MQLDDFKIGPLKFRDPFGQTFAAEQRESGKAFDVTILHPAIADIPEFRQIFRAEAEAAASLTSPRLVRVITSGSAPGGDFLVSEAVNLTPLANSFADHRFFSIPATTSFVQALAAATRSVHIDGLIHGALSPHFILTDSHFRRVQISRCGFERSMRWLVLRNEASLSGATPYFSPEVLAPGKALRRQSDIFSIGVLFYQLLVGRLPWPEKSDQSSFDPISRLGVVPPSLQRIEIPDILDEVILRALEPEVEDRWANLSSFIKALSEVQTSLLASFTPTSALIFQPDFNPGETTAPQQLLTDEEGDPEPAAGSNDDRLDPPDFPVRAEALPLAAPNAEAPRIEPEPAFGRAQDRLERSDLPGEPEASRQVVSGDRPLNGEPEQNPAPVFINNEAPVESPDLPPRPESEPEPETLGREPRPEPKPPAPQIADEQTDAILEGAPDQQMNYKQLLLEHEKDFFVDLAIKPTSRKSTIDLTGAKDEEAAGKEKRNSLLPGTAPSPFAELQGEAPAFRQEIDPPAPAMRIPGRCLPRAFVELQASEFDDGLSLRRRSVSTTATRPAGGPATVSGTPQKNGIAKKSARPGATKSKVKPQPLPSSQAAADGEIKSGTHTADFAPTKAIRRQPLIPAVNPIVSFLRTALLVVAPLALIYLLVSFVFDLDFDFRNSLFWQRFSTSAPVAEAGRGSQLTPVSPARRPGDRKAQSAGRAGAPRGSASSPQNKRRQPRRRVRPALESGSNLIASKMPLPPAGADRRIGSADASSVQAEQTGGLTIALLAEAGNVTQVADVFLDGRHVGSTSALGRIDIKNLVPARSYLIKVQKTGFKMWAREVRFQKRGTQQLFVRLQALHNLSSAARTSSRPDAARGFAAGKVKRSPRKTPRSTRSNRFPGPQAAANYGTVEVLLDNSEPLSDAYVYVNQALWNGQSYTAPAQLQLPAGTYLIEVRKDGYFSAPPSQTIEIIDGESRTLRFILTAR